MHAKAASKATPFAFPKQVSLRSCFIAFDEKYKIFEASDRSRFKISDDAADLWRKMLKDAVAVKKTGIFSHLLQPLMDALRWPHQSELEAATPSPSAVPSSSTDCPGDEDESDVEIISMFHPDCSCPQCLAARGPCVGSPTGSTSKAAEPG